MSSKSMIPVSVKKPNANGSGFLSSNNFFSVQRPSGSSNNFFHPPNSNHHIDQSRIPSTIKSTGRINRFSNNNGFSNSIKKNSANLFGVTPQISRSSYLQNGPPSTSRLSRSSCGYMKDSRQLSDPSYQRLLQDKIVEFLNVNGYPISIQRQNLARLSMAEACRIFQFLFSFITKDIVIKNGPDTSLDVVVSKMLPVFGYPYPIKRSDLVSFSGGRQLGSVLSMMEYLIDFITYCLKVNVENFAKRSFDLELEENDDGLAEKSKVEQQLLEMACNLDWKSLDKEEQEKRLVEISEEIYGTEAEFEQLSSEVENMQQTLKKLNDELDYQTEIPKMKQEIEEELERCCQYIKQMKEHNEDNEKLRESLLEEIRVATEKLEKLKKEQKELERRVDEQKEVRMEYEYCIDRSVQLKEENKQLEEQIETYKESIRTLRIEINKKRSECEALAEVSYDTLSLLFEWYQNSKFQRLLPDSAAAKFRLDEEWLKIQKGIQEMKSIPDGPMNDLAESQQLEEFQTLAKKKIQNQKISLLSLITDIETRVSLQVACEHQKAQGIWEKLNQELANRESQLKSLWNQKNENNEEHRVEFEKLEQEADMLKAKILELEKMFAKSDGNGSRLKIEYEIQEMEEQNKRKNIEFVRKFRELIKKQQEIEDRYHQKLNEQNAIDRKKIRLLEHVTEKLKKINVTI